MIRAQAGQVCSYHSEAVDTWVRFFQDMECGTRMSCQDLRASWIADLQRFQQDRVDLDLAQLPTLTDLELALRRVPIGRASGPDGLPGELCKYHSATVAKLLYAAVLKMLVHCHEPLGFKGGRLTPAYKGRGAKDECTSYRSLLVSNHLGKVLHRTIRQQCTSLYERYMQMEQTGGRRRIPVQLAVHQLRAFQQQGQVTSTPTGILYLDLAETFYRIFREKPSVALPLMK